MKLPASLRGMEAKLDRIPVEYRSEHFEVMDQVFRLLDSGTPLDALADIAEYVEEVDTCLKDVAGGEQNPSHTLTRPSHTPITHAHHTLWAHIVLLLVA